MQENAPNLSPVSAGERVFALDLIRGCALVGVLVAYTTWNLGSPSDETYGLADRVLENVLTFLVDTKAYTLFATLFGLGFSIQMARAEARGGGIARVTSRRLGALLVIGLAHALLLRNGDILVPYAVLGGLLLLFRNASSRTLAVAAAIAVAFPYLARAGWAFAGIPIPPRPDGTGMSYFAENVAWVRYWYTTSILFWPSAVPMFLAGFYLGRLRIVERAAERPALFRRAIVVGLVVGVLAYACQAWMFARWSSPPRPFLFAQTVGVLWSVHSWGLATFYASTLIVLAERPVWRRRLAPLAAFGRMALTNYLLQATIVVPVCLGLHLFGQVTPSRAIVLALAVWSVQVPASIWWLERYRFGPAEWLWRSLTYGRPQPMRVADAEAPSVTVVA